MRKLAGAAITAGVIGVAVAGGHPASAQGDPPSTECQVVSKDTQGMDPKILAEAEELTRQLCLRDRDKNR